MVDRTKAIIKDWLAESSRDEINSTKSEEDNDIVTALYSYLEDINNKYLEDIKIDDVCNVLFEYYRTSKPEKKRFTLQYLPQILYVYLNAIAHSDKKTSRSIEAFIIGVYNLEIVDDNGQPKVLSFRLPSLAQSSIFHEPVSLGPASLTESSLKRLEQRDSQLVRCGPLQPVDKLVAQNRLSVLSELLFSYNKHISLLSKSSMETLEKICKVSSKIVTQGFSKSTNGGVEMYRRSSLVLMNSDNVPRVLPRITVSSSFLCQLLYGLYFAMFNGFKYEALQAIEAVAVRAGYQGLNDVILLTNAIKNYLNESQTDSGLMGIGVPVASTITTTTTTTLSKSMITNASFRTKKLPDDIPIQDPHHPSENADGLGAISEEKEDNNNTPEIHPRRSLPKMAASFGKKTKEKIAIAVKSGSVSSIKSVTKSNSIMLNGGDASETDESGIELGGSDISNLAMQENDNSSSPFTPNSLALICLRRCLGYSV